MTPGLKVAALAVGVVGLIAVAGTTFVLFSGRTRPTSADPGGVHRLRRHEDRSDYRPPRRWGHSLYSAHAVTHGQFQAVMGRSPARHAPKTSPPQRGAGGQRHLGRGGRVLPTADGEGAGQWATGCRPRRSGSTPAGPGRDDAVLRSAPARRRRSRPTSTADTLRPAGGPSRCNAADDPVGSYRAERLRAVRHARQRLGVVRRPGGRGPAGRPGRVVAGAGCAVPVVGAASASATSREPDVGFRLVSAPVN